MIMTEALDALATYIADKKPDLLLSSDLAFGELTLTSSAEKIIALLTFLRDDAGCGFINFTDI